MNSIESINRIEPCEVDGVSQLGLRSGKDLLTVREHWNRREFVVLEYKDINITVMADELIRAIENAQNAHRF